MHCFDDLEAARHLQETISSNERTDKRRRLNWIEGNFIMGKIPLDWISEAAKLKGKTLNVALAIWFHYGLNSKRQGFTLPNKFLKEFSLGEGAKFRALNRLLSAGLIHIDKPAHSVPRITILKTNMRRGRPYISGPIPLAWLARAAKRGVNALKVGVAIWYWDGMQKEPETLELRNETAKYFGLDRKRKCEGVRELEEAELIRVESRGRKPSQISLVLEGL